MEARTSPDQARSTLQKVKDYKADLAKLRADVKKAAAGGGGAAGSAESRCAPQAAPLALASAGIWARL